MFYKQGMSLYYIDDTEVWHFIADIRDTYLDRHGMKGEIELPENPPMRALKEVEDRLEGIYENMGDTREELRDLKWEVQQFLKQ